MSELDNLGRNEKYSSQYNIYWQYHLASFSFKVNISLIEINLITYPFALSFLFNSILLPILPLLTILPLLPILPIFLILPLPIFLNFTRLITIAGNECKILKLKPPIILSIAIHTGKSHSQLIGNAHLNHTFLLNQNLSALLSAPIIV